MSHYNCPAYGSPSYRTYQGYQQPRCWSIIECPSGNNLFAINSYDTLKLTTFDDRISISGNSCEKTITFDLNTDVSFNNIDVNGDALITGKLTVGGLIDPTGLVLEHQAAAPHTNTGTQGTLWVNGNDLKFTDSTAATITLGAGGGGGGGGGESLWKVTPPAPWAAGTQKFLEPSGTDISGIILNNTMIRGTDTSGIIIGDNHDASGAYSVCIGLNNFIDASSVVVMGVDCTNAGWCSFLGGKAGEIKAWPALGQVGPSGELAGSYCFSWGKRNLVSGLASTAFGCENQVSSTGQGKMDFAVGYQNVVDSSGGFCALAVGVQNEVRGPYAVALGGANTVNSGDGENANDGYAYALGFGNDVSGNWGSAAIGGANVVKGASAFAVGAGCRAEGDGTFALGDSAEAGTAGFEDVAFAIGVGSGSDNCFQITNEAKAEFLTGGNLAGGVYISETLDVSGNLTVEGSQVDICGNLAVGGQVEGGLRIAGDVHIEEVLWCENTLDVSGNLTVEGSQVDICGNLAVGGQVEGGLRIEGGSTNDVYIEDDLDVSGNVRIAGNVHIDEVLWCENTLDVSGNLTVEGSQVDICGNLTVSGNLAFNGQVEGGLRIEGGSTNDVYIEDDLDVSGNVRIAGDVHIEEVLWCENTLDVSGNLTVEGSQVDICGNLAVGGNLALNGQVEGGLRIEGGSTNDVYIEDDLDVSGNVRIAGDVHIEEVLWCENTLDVSGNLTVEGSQVDICGNLAVGGNIKCESLDVSGARIRYSVGNDWVHSGSGTNTIPSTHAVVQVSGGTPGGAVACDISNTSAKNGQILIILVPSQQELDFSGAANVVMGSATKAMANTSVQFVYMDGKWYPLGLQ